MSKRILLQAFMSAAAIATMSGCHAPSTPPQLTTTAASATSSSTMVATSPTPTSAALTRQPCDLLTPEVAKKFVGEDAQRRLAYEARPPVPVGDEACYYTGATREIEVSIFPRPSDPTAPVNHFHVIRPDNRVHAVSYEAYWFGPGESIVAVKDGLLISVKVANIKGDWTDQDRADDIELANLVVPQVG
jgi:hypothetical protein